MMNSLNSPLDIVFFGDSLCTEFYVTKVIPSMVRARKNIHNPGWPSYLDLNTQTYATVSGYLQPAPSIRMRSKLLLGAKPLHKLLKQYKKTFRAHPKAYFIWIGHNNLDWKADIPPGLEFKDYLKSYSLMFYKHLLDSLLILKQLPRPERKTKILLSTLVNFPEFFTLRDRGLEENLFPHASLADEIFISMLPENRHEMLQLMEAFNQQIRLMVSEQSDRFDQHNYELCLVEEFEKVPLNDLRILNEFDGWHLSEYGREYFARYIAPTLKKHLETCHP